MNPRAIVSKYPVFFIILLIVLIISGVYGLFQIRQARELAKPDDVEIVKSWNLPDVLLEISGIAYLDSRHLACLQDERGIIFIFDLTAAQLVDKIPFGKTGDYEAIRIVENTAYVLRSDGVLYEILNFQTANKPEVNSYDTHLTPSHNLEGLAYDKNKDRLLLSMKESDHETNNYKGVYAFDLTTKKLSPQPVFKLNVNKKIAKTRSKFLPSEIAVDPLSGKMYVLRPNSPEIIELKNGTPKRMIELNDYQFSQAEGLAFGTQGEIFIACEQSPGKLYQIKFTSKEKTSN